VQGLVELSIVRPFGARVTASTRSSSGGLTDRFATRGVKTLASRSPHDGGGLGLVGFDTE
jgi:hypothetical protein